MLMISSPQVKGRFQMLLLVNLIGNVLRNRALTYTIKTKETTYVNGLPKKEFDHIKRLLYGPGGGAGGGPQMDRFVRSFIELGYPRAGRECIHYIQALFSNDTNVWDYSVGRVFTNSPRSWPTDRTRLGRLAYEFTAATDRSVHLYLCSRPVFVKWNFYPDHQLR